MENPYAPRSNGFGEQQSSASKGYWLVAIGVLWGLMVLGNYLTATEIYWSTQRFMNFVFVSAPVAAICHLRLFLGNPSERAYWYSFAAGLLVLLGFLDSWAPWFSQELYAQFVLKNAYFGHFAWMSWTWLILTGLFPLALATHAVRNYKMFRRALSFSSY